MTIPGSERNRQPVGWIDQSVFQLRDNWNNFWFAPVDPTPLCVLRILVGGMLVYSHLVWGIDLQAFLGPDGWNSTELIRAFQKGQWNSSFWWDVPVESMQTVHQVCIGILILFWIGFLTRITSVLSFAIHISYCQRAAISNFGLDQISGILLMYLMLSPCGAAYSLDSLIFRFLKSRRTPKLNAIQPEELIPKSVAAGLSTRLIQVHYCIIYFFAGTGKLQGEAWWTGAAMWRAFANYEYQSMDMTWLSRFPEVLQLVTHIVILWELSFAYLIWVRPLRPWMLIMGALMHLGIGACLGMWTFGLMMIFGYIAFLKPSTVRTIVSLPITIFQSTTSSD